MIFLCTFLDMMNDRHFRLEALADLEQLLDRKQPLRPLKIRKPTKPSLRRTARQTSGFK